MVMVPGPRRSLADRWFMLAQSDDRPIGMWGYISMSKVVRRYIYIYIYRLAS